MPHRARRRDSLENREGILTAALAVFSRNPDAPLDEVVAAAGLSRRAFYGHFASRKELVTELARRGAERVAAGVAGIRHDDSRVELALLAAGMWQEIAGIRLLARAAVRGPLQPVVAEALSPLRARIAAVVRTGVGVGELRGDIEPGTLAHLVEGAALAVLDEAARSDLSDDTGRALAVAAVLGVAGLSWREAQQVAATALPEGDRE